MHLFSVLSAADLPTFPICTFISILITVRHVVQIVSAEARSLLGLLFRAATTAEAGWSPRIYRWALPLCPTASLRHQSCCQGWLNRWWDNEGWWVLGSNSCPQVMTQPHLQQTANHLMLAQWSQDILVLPAVWHLVVCLPFPCSCQKLPTSVPYLEFSPKPDFISLKFNHCLLVPRLVSKLRVLSFDYPSCTGKRSCHSISTQPQSLFIESVLKELVCLRLEG